ncbi:MAG TPA: sugar ABC transporter permease [Myxococcales bacterium]|nr:sugar ABC transporter permease [Myxococcales bacterium]
MNREARAGVALAAPAFVVLAGVAVAPVLAAVWLSLHRSILVFHEHRFVGLGNFQFLLSDGRFWSALGTTAYFTAVAVGIELLLGLPLALLLQNSGGLFRAALLLPWAVPTAISARLWAWLFNPQYGLLHRLLPAVDWLGSPRIALHAAILVDVWKTTPFVALLLLAGLQSIPDEVVKAARIDGARPARIFRSITLPLLKPAILLALLFRSLDAFRVFDAIYVLTEGGPGNSTETLSIYAYKTMLRAGDFGYGSTLAVATFLCVACIGLLFGRALRERT